jgi:hypothetical protein
MLPPQMSSLAATSTIPVTNAAKQENTRRSCRILIMAASPAPTRPPDLADGPSRVCIKLLTPQSLVLSCTEVGAGSVSASENPTNSPSAPQLSPSAWACAPRAVLNPGDFSILFDALAQKSPAWPKPGGANLPERRVTCGRMLRRASTPTRICHPRRGLGY